MKVQSKYLARAKKIVGSEHYVIGCTGASVVILDQDLRLIKRISGLSYVYEARISPDETKLLLVSQLNVFYLLSLDTFVLEKHTIRRPYNHGLEGRGCWSFDSKFFYLPLFHLETRCSVLRRFDASDCSYIDVFPEKYWIHDVISVAPLKKYLAVGTAPHENISKFIWFDGQRFDEEGVEEYTLRSAQDMNATSLEYDAEKGRIILFSGTVKAYFSPDGKACRRN